MVRLYPSLIAANPLCLNDTLQELAPYCAGFHCDIMDNHFVPNLTFGADIVNAIDAATPNPTWVHLMVDNPLHWCSNLSLKTDSIVSFHIESTAAINKVINSIKENKWKVSLAIKPKTAIGETFRYLNVIDQLLVMSVEPGFAGQRFLEPVTDKITQLALYRTQHNLTFQIGVDGGINTHNIGSLVQEGADDIAIASAIFNESNPCTALQALSKIAHTARK